jgi:hypothetical protein
MPILVAMAGSGEAKGAWRHRSRANHQQTPSHPGKPANGSGPAAQRSVGGRPAAEPRITTLLKLDGAHGRVNQLLAAGQITDAGAERLWEAVAKQSRGLENPPAAEEVMP